MSALLTIELKGLRFFGYHGLYPEERKVGTEYEVNLSVSFGSTNKVIADLNETINYEALHELVKGEMMIQRDLLETFVTELCERIHISFPQIKKIELAIAKLHPPIARFTGSVGVKYEKEY
jgi:dihydroneopterin aldolase